VNHNLLKHEKCTIPSCAICSETVRVCLTCHGSETQAGGNGLTTQCFEAPLTEEQKLSIAKGDLDYINNRWFDKRLGPTIKDKLYAKMIDLKTGHILKALNPADGRYICVGVYSNSAGQTIYAFHQEMSYGNRAAVGFVSLIHYSKFEELFGDITNA
jgi:hypothetical protein